MHSTITVVSEASVWCKLIIWWDAVLWKLCYLPPGRQWGQSWTNGLQVHIHLHYAEWVLQVLLQPSKFGLGWFLLPDAIFLCMRYFFIKQRQWAPQQGTDFVRPWTMHALDVSQCVKTKEHWLLQGTGGLESWGPKEDSKTKILSLEGTYKEHSYTEGQCRVTSLSYPFSKSHLPAPGHSTAVSQGSVCFQGEENTFPGWSLCKSEIYLAGRPEALEPRSTACWKQEAILKQSKGKVMVLVPEECWPSWILVSGSSWKTQEFSITTVNGKGLLDLW